MPPTVHFRIHLRLDANLVAKSASIATLATGFYTYLADFFQGWARAVCRAAAHRAGRGPLEIRTGRLLAIGLILFLREVNYLGVRWGGECRWGFTALKLAVLIGGLMAAATVSGRASTANLDGGGGRFRGEWGDFSRPW
jgi:amino acid transporter